MSLGEFLRARRELVSPEQAGLVPRTTARRVPGLRREEVATLAGISIEYLTRLERGKDRSPSRQVIDALCVALHLEPEAVRYLHSLVWPIAAADRADDEPVPALLRALSRFEGDIAYILGPRFDILARTRVADAFLGPAVHGNQVEHLFTDPTAADIYPDWDEVATQAVAALRSRARGSHDDPALHAMLDRLRGASEPFARLWSRHEIHGSVSGTKRIVHPRFGTITVAWDALTTAYPGDQTIVLYTTEPGSASEAALEAVRRSLTSAS
ncbi:helix-turn-helix domain-containing protein [Catenuloplanes japonicus]|uniref:helix-turn-helix domain-containing protein n=1 Tax=Catenuloplanes japonicus TaxID=33876 RepID=UPI00052570CF|nr:helix-turn-helix transcriptional regulator [Catenuloplanes japonicus]